MPSKVIIIIIIQFKHKYVLAFLVVILTLLRRLTGGPSSSCEMSILRNNSHGGIIRVCMGIFTTALRNKKYVKFSKKKTSPYFHSVSLVI